MISKLPVEVLEGNNDPPSRASSGGATSAAMRQETLMRARSGQRVVRWTQRQRLRRMLVSWQWQLFLLLTAVVDMAMLAIEIGLEESRSPP